MTRNYCFKIYLTNKLGTVAHHPRLCSCKIAITSPIPHPPNLKRENGLEAKYCKIFIKKK